MGHLKKILCISVCLTVLLFSAGCGQTGQSAEKGTGNAYAAITDDAGQTVVLQEKPQRVVVLSGSLLHFAAAVDGDVVGRVSLNSDDTLIPEKYKAAAEVGPVYQVSTEKTVALQPDLVIAVKGQHDKIAGVFKANGIPVLLLSTKSYDDVKRNMTCIARIYGKEKEGQEQLAAMAAKIDAICGKVDGHGKKAAILHATAKNVTLELPRTIAGSTAELLGFENIAAAAAQTTDGDRVPYSMETLVDADPDVIFITTMGKGNNVDARLQQYINDTDAWQSLSAVRKGRVYVLPENLFLINPGLDYPQALAFMAHAVWPEVVL